MSIDHGLDGSAGRGLLFLHGGLPMVGTSVEMGMKNITLEEIGNIDTYSILMENS
jgi:hypothetical protein